MSEARETRRKAVHASTTNLFVYGTLLSGEENHAHLCAARLLRRTHTAPRFHLVDLGPFPGLVEGGTTAVAGEIYEVDEQTLEALDRFEDHPNLFRRTPILLEDGTVTDAYLFADRGAARGLPRIASGDYRRRKSDA